MTDRRIASIANSIGVRLEVTRRIEDTVTLEIKAIGRMAGQSIVLSRQDAKVLVEGLIGYLADSHAVTLTVV